MGCRFQIAIALCLLLSEVIPAPQEVGKTLIVSWDENSESDLAGYSIHYGSSSRIYGDSIDVGNVTLFEIDSLTVGEIYFFAVTAYDDSGNVSDFSNEVSAIITARPPDTTAAKKWDLSWESKTGKLDSLIVLEVVAHGDEMQTGSGWTIWGHGKNTDSGLYILNPDGFMVRIVFDVKLIGDGSCLKDPEGNPRSRMLDVAGNPWLINTSWQTVEITSDKPRIFINYADDCYIEEESDANVRIENLKIFK